MKPKVYIETSVISYLVSRPSGDVIVAGRQQVTREWWEQRRGEFELFVSALVLKEASAGDGRMAALRLNELDGIRVLQPVDKATALTRDLVTKGPLPMNATEDAGHIALAAVHGVDYLLTWNCRHLANAEMRQAVALRCLWAGFEAPIICTPEELMGS